MGGLRNMPLHKGSSKPIRNKNIQKLMNEYKKSGKIGRIKPKSSKHAAEIASAIAYRLQREAKRR